MSKMKMGCLSLVGAITISGCGTPKSVMKLSASDSNANAGQFQFNIVKSPKRVIQFEVDSINATDDMGLQGAINESGQGEQRLLDLNQKNPEQNAFVGPGEVQSSHKIQHINARMIFKLDNYGHFQFALAPQINFLHADSQFTYSGRSFNFSSDKIGAGIYGNMKIPFHKTFSLNISDSTAIYSGGISDNVLALYFRLEPSENWYVDLGRYRNFVDFKKSMNVSYEEKIVINSAGGGPFGPGCDGTCIYDYDGKHDSRVEVSTDGYRLGFGLNF